MSHAVSFATFARWFPRMCLGILAVAFGAALATTPALAVTWYVRAKGNDLADGETPATAFRTVVRAAQALNHGDSLVIGPGTYREAALLADRASADGGAITVAGDESGKLTGDAAGPVVIEPAGLSDPAMHFYRFRNLTVSGLTFRGAGQGLKIEKCLGATVARSTFDGQSKGLALVASEDLRVESCVFARCAIGLWVQSCVRTRVAHVTVATSSSAGLIVLQSGAGAVRNCLFANNAASLVADALSASAWTSDRNVLAGPIGPWGSVPTVFNVSEWFSASGQDRHSVHVVPTFADPKTHDLHIGPAVIWAGGLPGMNVGEQVAPPVAADRDGRPFRVRDGATSAGAYDCPDPKPSAAWRKLSAALPKGGPRQSAAIYREDGTLLRTLLADATAVRELWWDGLDDLGMPAPAGAYQVRAIAHDARLLDDGAVGDNGNPMGIFNCDNADRVAVMPDGGFVITAVYDEAGYPLRRYSPSGQPVLASGLAEGGFWGLAVTTAGDLVGGRGTGDGAVLVRLTGTGERAPMAGGAEQYPVSPGEKDTAPFGLAVVGDDAFVSIPAKGLVRVIDLATGQKKADWALPGVGDLARDERRTVWALAGQDVVSLGADGKVERKYPTGLEKPMYLAAGAGRLAAVDRREMKVAVLDAGSGKPIATFGEDRSKEYWMPVRPRVLRDPRGAALLPDGRLIVTQQARVRILWPENLERGADLISNFMESAVVHPTRPEYVYCGSGIYRVDPKTGAWQWVVETAPHWFFGREKEADPWFGKRLGSPGGAVVLGGRPFLFYYNRSYGSPGQKWGSLTMVDITDPLKPRLALDYAATSVLGGQAYSTISFTRGGDIVAAKGGLNVTKVRFKGLDAANNPTFEFDKPEVIGPEKDSSPRGLASKGAISCDRTTGDIYFLATTALYNKMVPGWGADGTGMARSTPDGRPLWFSLSSGGNYMSVSTVHDGKNVWVLAGKSFGGQIDVFDADGLRVTTGNWSWPSSYTMGFVDLRYGVHAYMRPDGKPGAYVEDDAIGRFCRARLDGAETLQRRTAKFEWKGGGAAAGAAALPDRTSGEGLARLLVAPKVAGLKVDGDWTAWEREKVAPQIISLPSAVGFKRAMAADLLQTFREGTFIGAVAHDARSFYVYLLAADDTPHFDSPVAGRMWMFDSFEVWIEEEQFGLGFLKDGTPALSKYRHHNREGKPYSAGYDLARENVWGERLRNLGAHPLGRQLAAITGVSFEGKPGYAVMAKIPFDEVKLVGGIAGRTGDKILPMAGRAGEIVRLAVSLDNISAWGRAQDYQVDWPVGKMFSDPTRSAPFALGP